MCHLLLIRVSQVRDLHKIAVCSMVNNLPPGEYGLSQLQFLAVSALRFEPFSLSIALGHKVVIMVIVKV